MSGADTPRPRPALMAVDDDADALSRLQQELGRRYEPDYRVLCERTPEDALATLEKIRAAGEDVAVVLADQWMPDMTGEELLARVKERHPRAKRALLVGWRVGRPGDRRRDPARDGDRPHRLLRSQAVALPR